MAVASLTPQVPKAPSEVNRVVDEVAPPVEVDAQPRHTKGAEVLQLWDEFSDSVGLAKTDKTFIPQALESERKLAGALEPIRQELAGLPVYRKEKLSSYLQRLLSDIYPPDRGGDASLVDEVARSSSWVLADMIRRNAVTIS